MVSTAEFNSCACFKLCNLLSSLDHFISDDSSFQEMSPEFPKKKKIEVHEVFNQDEDDNDGLGSARKRKLVPLGKN
jgi:hypothetical protein